MRWILLAAASSAVVTSAAMVSGPAAAPAQSSVPAVVSGRYVGVASCVNSGCHGSMNALSSTSVLQNEYHTWLSSDRHAGAYNILFSELSARIARNMRLKKAPYQEKFCLDCHTTNVAASSVAGRIDVEDGVQCESCHGAASGWRDTHSLASATHAQSVTRGMTDLRDLPTRSHTCNGCHVGSGTREIDHEAVASGHPLLAFELDNYSAAMPPHWKPDHAKGGAEAWAAGQIVTLADSLAMLAKHGRTRWPEFSDMTCTGCHFALASRSPGKGSGERLGLPSWNPRHWIVSRQLIARSSPAALKQLETLFGKLGATAANMNDAKSVAEGAEAARAIVVSTLPAVRKLSWSESDIRSIMRTIATTDAGDVQSAEQIALSLQTLAVALSQNGRQGMALMPPIDGLFAELEKPYEYAPARFNAKLAALRKML
jgi:hypothetical protein